MHLTTVVQMTEGYSSDLSEWSSDSSSECGISSLTLIPRDSSTPAPILRQVKEPFTRKQERVSHTTRDETKRVLERSATPWSTDTRESECDDCLVCEIAFYASRWRVSVGYTTPESNGFLAYILEGPCDAQEIRNIRARVERVLKQWQRFVMEQPYPIERTPTVYPYPP